MDPSDIIFDVERLRAGDVMDCEITGLGARRNRCLTGG